MLRPPACSTDSAASTARPSDAEQDSCGDRIGDRLHASAGLQVGSNHRLAAAHLPCVGEHAIEIDADMRREIDLVDDQEITAQQTRPALARNVIAAGDIDDEDPPVDEIEREGRSEIVATGFEQDQLDTRK